MTTFVLIHGSWHNGTAWRKLQVALTAKGVTSYAPTLTGFESVGRPAPPEIGLRVHIQDIATFIEQHATEKVILVGHSYGGLINSGVAEIIPQKLAGLVYLDAFIPDSDQSLFDIMGAEQTASMRKNLTDDRGRTLADGATQVWLLPPGRPQDYGVTAPEDIAWLEKEMPYTPVRTFEEGVPLKNPMAAQLPKAFIRCTEFGYLAPQEQKAIRLKWKTYQLPTGHDAMVTMPGELAELLVEIAKG